MKRFLLYLGGLIGSFMLSTSAYSQAYPFPQNVNYSFGNSPANANSSHAAAAYNAWKNEYLVKADNCENGSYRVKFDIQNQSVSEGIAYGMLLTAYAGDKEEFDGLWKYYLRFKNSRGFMHWKVNTNCNIIAQNGATDADADAAMALYVAHWQWGSTGSVNYLADCKDLINKIKQYEVIAATKVVRPGDEPSWTQAGTTLINISYMSPAYYRVFATINTADKDFWNDVADQCYVNLNNNLNSSNGNQNNGLVSDWSHPNGSVPAPGATGVYKYNGANFYYDAARTPWRIATDYLWFGTAEAKAYCNKTTDFVKNDLGGSGNIKGGYTMNGNPLNNDHNNTFVGCFAVGAMASDISGVQNHLNTSYTDNVNTSPYSGQYFNNTLKALTLFTLTGNFYLPPPDACEAPDLGDDVSLCTGSPVNLNTGLTASGRTFEWKRNGSTIGSATGTSYNATQAGVYEVITDENGCTRRDVVEVFEATPSADFTFNITATQSTFDDNSTGGATSWIWDVDGNNSTDYTSQNPSHTYSTSGLYDVTLTVKNECNISSSVTKQVAIGNPGSAEGWFETNFKTSNWQGVNVWEGSSGITLDQTGCSEFTINATSDIDKYKNVSITMKKGGNDAYIDVEDYPYVQIRYKVNKSIDKLRVDLGEGAPGYGSTSTNPAHLTGKANSNGGFDPIPANEWIVSTVDFTGRFAGDIDPKTVAQFLVYPFATDETNFKITIDWVIIGYAQVEAPAPNISDESICGNGTVTLDAEDCDAESYLWSTGEITSSIEAGPGTYWVDVTNFGGTTRESVTVTGSGTPIAGFTQVVNENEITFTNGSTNATSYSWDFDGEGSSTLENPTFTFTSEGTYTVCLTAEDGCSNTDQSCSDVTISEIVTDPDPTPTAIGDIESNSTLIYPNPASEVITIETMKDASVSVLALSGALVLEKRISSSSNQIDISNLTNGTYLIKITNDDTSVVTKLIKQ